MKREQTKKTPISGFGILRGERILHFKRDREGLKIDRVSPVTSRIIPKTLKPNWSFSRLWKALGINNDLGS